MPRIRYKVTLEEPERQMLKEITTRGRHSSQKVLNALILLKCDEGRFQDRKLTNQAIADVLPVSLKKIDRVKRRFVEQGLEAVLDKRKPERTYRRKADGDFEAHLIAVSCGKPPPGHARWSLRLLADRWCLRHRAWTSQRADMLARPTIFLRALLSVVLNGFCPAEELASFLHGLVSFCTASTIGGIASSRIGQSW